MGVGKTVIGRALARRLKMRFLDSDAAIEEEAGLAIADIFERFGEEDFRGRERRFIDAGHPPSGCVVSCGGGLPIQPGMGELLTRKGIVVCLFAQAETIVKRTVGNPKRPLLNVEDPEARLRELLAQREPVYKTLGIGISTEGRSIAEVLQNLMRTYRREEKAWKPARPADRRSSRHDS
ncbi:MAG: shikimate kinase [Verrucomicrobia bacterium]|jgi:shikimate kinase|nr:shikimate kinase [Verrucomicrobiota bacterium]